MAKHGKPKEVISDAFQFKLASDVMNKLWRNILSENDVLSYATNENIKCNYIVELEFL